MIHIRNLSKAFGKTTVLSHVEAHFAPGRVHGIVGANGSGKTTLFRCIAGLESHEGHVDSALDPLKNHLGFLPAEPYFMSRMTGKEYIRLVCQARGLNVEMSADNNLFELPLDAYASTYSTGMKKKLALTGVLLQRNDVFILDEPFNGVDIESNLLIAEVIRSLGAMGKCVLVSSHIFSTLRETCNALYVLKDGSLGAAIEPADYDATEEAMKGKAIGNRLDFLTS